VADDHGEIVLAVLVFRDVTAERELARSREDFIRMISTTCGRP